VTEPVCDNPDVDVHEEPLKIKIPARKSAVKILSTSTDDVPDPKMKPVKKKAKKSAAN
jgi:hypothetical protein